MSKFTFDLSPELREKAEQAAVENLMSLAEWIRMAVREQLVRPEFAASVSSSTAPRQVPRYAAAGEYCISTARCTASHHFPACPMNPLKAR